MGFSKPKAIAAPAAPPPVTTSAPEVARAEEEERRKQLLRQGYDWTLNPGRSGGGGNSRLSAPNTVRGAGSAAGGNAAGGNSSSRSKTLLSSP